MGHRELNPEPDVRPVVVIDETMWVRGPVVVVVSPSPSPSWPVVVVVMSDVARGGRRCRRDDVSGVAVLVDDDVGEMARRRCRRPLHPLLSSSSSSPSWCDVAVVVVVVV